MLSIQAFSHRTGIPKSTLRFYEEKELLIPIRDKENGYRLYEEEQIELARFIASLRAANVPLREIRNYIVADRQEQKDIKEAWIYSLKQQRQLLDIQITFLESDFLGEQIYLMERQSERVVWLFAEGNKGEFAPYFLKGKEELKKNAITIKHCYLQYVSGMEKIQVWIGFGIASDCDISTLSLFEREERLPYSLCVATSFQGDFTKIEIAYRELVKYVSEHHYIPTGSLMEMYHGTNMDSVTILIPVMRLGGKDNETGASS